LCFRYRKLGHISKDYKQEPRKGQQHKGKQLRATVEFCATRGAYNTTSAITPKKRSNEQLRKLYKECTSLSNEEIKKELEKEDSTKYESINNDWPAKDLNVLAATNQEPLTSNKESSNK
jgi:hypothetical protein